MTANIGDRIELVSMTDDPCPLPAGATGTINLVNPVSRIGSTPAHVQYGVKWDAPHERRTLMLVCPPDQFKVLR